MDLLETILRTANAEKYLENFRSEEIEARSLKLLTEEDLELLGINDAEARKSILKQSQDLCFANETKIDTTLKQDYLKLVLSQIKSQLNLYNATLTCITTRPDIINCDIQLVEASNALSNTINDLQLEVAQLKRQICMEKGLIVDKIQNNPKKRVIFRGVLASMFLVANFYVLKKLLL